METLIWYLFILVQCVIWDINGTLVGYEWTMMIMG